MGDIFLQIEIKNDAPVELNVLSHSLNSLASQYDSLLLKKLDINFDKIERRLLVKNISKGSIIIDLVAGAMPILSNFNAVFEFSKYLKDTFDFFLNKTKEANYSYLKKDCQDIKNITDITARDNHNAYVNYNVYHIDKIENKITYNNTEANAIQRNVEKYEEEQLIQEQEKIFKKEGMYWASAKFINNRSINTDGKIIIEKFDKVPKKAIFVNENDKIKATTRHPSEPNQEWQNLLWHIEGQSDFLCK